MNRMLLALKRPFIWLYRFRHRCGYGVHSPFAFNLITHVIYETTPYYKYKELASEQKRLMPQKDRAWGYESLKVKRLLFRLVNYAQPATIVDAGMQAASSLYMKLLPPTCPNCFWRVARLSTFYTCTITAVRSLWKRCSVSVPTALRKRPSL